MILRTTTFYTYQVVLRIAGTCCFPDACILLMGRHPHENSNIDRNLRRSVSHRLFGGGPA